MGEQRGSRTLETVLILDQIRSPIPLRSGLCNYFTNLFLCESKWGEGKSYSSCP